MVALRYYKEQTCVPVQWALRGDHLEDTFGFSQRDSGDYNSTGTQPLEYVSCCHDLQHTKPAKLSSPLSAYLLEYRVICTLT